LTPTIGSRAGGKSRARRGSAIRLRLPICGFEQRLPAPMPVHVMHIGHMRVRMAHARMLMEMRMGLAGRV